MQAPRPWSDAFDEYQIDHMVGGNLAAKMLATKYLAYPQRDLETIYADGQIFILAWKKDFRKKGLELSQQWQEQAFEKHEAELSKGMPPLVEDPGFWRLYIEGQKKSSLTSREAQFLLDYHRNFAVQPTWRLPYWATWQAGHFTPDAGLANGPLPYLVHLMELVPFILTEMGGVRQYVAPLNGIEASISQSGSDIGSPAAVLLALHRARKAVAVDPQDHFSYWVLAEGYRETLDKIEGFWVPPFRSNLRRQHAG